MHYYEGSFISCIGSVLSSAFCIASGLFAVDSVLFAKGSVICEQSPSFPATYAQIPLSIANVSKCEGSVVSDQCSSHFLFAKGKWVLSKICP